MDAASVWPVRRIRRYGGKLARIISVVKIKFIVKSAYARQTGEFMRQRSILRAKGEGWGSTSAHL
jgi:hypothetical protein